jgi:hypothetical protein
VLTSHLAREAAGAFGTRHSPRPLFFRGESFMHDSGASRRGNAESYLFSSLKKFNRRTKAPSSRPSEARAGTHNHECPCCAMLGGRSSVYNRHWRLWVPACERRDDDSELRPMSISLTSRSRSAAVHPSTPTSIRRVLFLSLRFRGFHPPHQIIGKTWKPPLQRLAAFADRLAFRGQGLRNGPCGNRG